MSAPSPITTNKDPSIIATEECLQAIKLKDFETAAKKIKLIAPEHLKYFNEDLGNGSFPAHMAIAHRAPEEFIKALFTAGADPWQKDDLGFTAVQHAQKQNLAMVQELLGFAKERLALSPQELRSTAQHEQKALNSLQAAQAFLELAPDVLESLKKAIQEGNVATCNTVDRYNMTPLFYGIMSYKQVPSEARDVANKNLEWLIQNTTNLLLVNKAEFSVLHVAINEDLPIPLIEKLLERAGADKRKLMEMTTLTGLNVLHVALLKRNEPLFRLLLKHAPQELVMQKDQNGLSSLMLYAKRIAEAKAAITEMQSRTSLTNKEILLCLVSCAPYVIQAAAYATGHEIPLPLLQTLSLALCMTQYAQTQDVAGVLLSTCLETAPLASLNSQLGYLQSWIKPMIQTQRTFSSIIAPLSSMMKEYQWYKYTPSLNMKTVSVRALNAVCGCARAWSPLPAF